MSDLRAGRRSSPQQVTDSSRAPLAHLPFGLALTRSVNCPDASGRAGSSCGPDRLGEGLVVAAIGLHLAGTIDDIVTAPGEVRRRNERPRGVAVVPMIRRDAGGLMVAAQF